MPTFVVISLTIAAAAALTLIVCAVDLWVRRQVRRGKYIVREKPITLCSANVIHTLRRQEGK